MATAAGVLAARSLSDVGGDVDDVDEDLDDEVLTWQQLVARAGSRDRARGMVERRVVRRVLRGAYVADGVPESPALRCRALRAVLPRHVVLSGRTALWAVGVDCLPRDGHLDVTTGRGLRLAHRPHLAVHSARCDDEELVDLAHGLVAVSAARAVVDVLRREPLVEGVAVADAALRSGAASAAGITASVGRASGLRGVVRARAALDHLEPRSESPGESRLRMALVLGGLGRPEAQVDLYDTNGRHLARVDLVLDGVVLEYDGREQRLRRTVFARDRSRQNTLVDAGVELRRYTATDVHADGRARLCAEVRRAVAKAAGLPPPAVQRGADTLPPPRLVPRATRADAADAA